MRRTIPAYIDLLCNGEHVLSRRLLETSVELCGALDGMMEGGGGGRDRGNASACGVPDPEESPQELRERALRALLATLLVLRVSPYWHRVAALQELFSWCLSLSARLDATRQSRSLRLKRAHRAGEMRRADGTPATETSSP